MVGNTGIAAETKPDADKDEEEEQKVDDRSIAHLMLDQIEFASVIVLSKAQIVKTEGAIAEIRSLLKKLNPGAQVVVPEKPHFADLPLSAVVNTGLFDMEKAQVSAGWARELAKATELGGEGHTPETEEYGISSVVFRSHKKPFHPAGASGLRELRHQRGRLIRSYHQYP